MAWICAAAGAVQAAPVDDVPYYHDFLGGICVRETDLERAFLVGGKGVRPPPLCLETPCAEKLDRPTYEREILGRPAEDAEWDDYSAMWDLVCTDQGAPDALTMLLPAVDSVEDPAVTAGPMVAETLEMLGIPLVVLKTASPWRDRGPVTPGPTYSPPRLPPLTWGGGGGGGGGGDGGGGGGGGSGPVGTPSTPIPLPPTILAALTGLMVMAGLAATRRRQDRA